MTILRDMNPYINGSSTRKRRFKARKIQKKGSLPFRNMRTPSSA